MVTLYQLGGVPIVTKALLRNGFLRGDVMTVTGKTRAESPETTLALETLVDRKGGHGPTRVFESEADTMVEIHEGRIKTGYVIVVRNVGPEARGPVSANISKPWWRPCCPRSRPGRRWARPRVIFISPA